MILRDLGEKHSLVCTCTLCKKCLQISNTDWIRLKNFFKLWNDESSVLNCRRTRKSFRVRPKRFRRAIGTAHRKQKIKHNEIVRNSCSDVPSSSLVFNLISLLLQRASSHNTKRSKNYVTAFKGGSRKVNVSALKASNAYPRNYAGTYINGDSPVLCVTTEALAFVLLSDTAH